jgi:hypothetical protein
MSSGGIFRLITNSGLQDKLLMATDYLNYRIKLISDRNRNSLKKDANGNIIKQMGVEASWVPEINDISKSHMVFINGSFKPFVASGFEYNKCSALSTPNLGNTVKFTLPVFGDFVNDCVVHVKLSELSAVSYLDRVRYVALIGHKIFKEVSFQINAAPLDIFTSDDYNSHYEFHVLPSKRIGWLRNMGQEIPIKAELTADPTTDMFKEYRFFGDGNQTFKQKHDSIELWIPLLFWFKDIKNALPNLVIPYGQTDINIKLADANELVGFADYGGGGAYKAPTITTMDLYMNNIFLQPEIVKIFMCKFGFSLIRVHGRHKEVGISNTSDSILLSGLKWPTETLYIQFKPQSNLSLSQYWYKGAQLSLNSVKVPVVAKVTTLATTGLINNTIPPTNSTASLLFGAGPALSVINGFYIGYNINITGGRGFNINNIITNRYFVSAYIGATFTVTIDGVWNNGTPDSTTTYELYTPQLAINYAQYYKETPSINKIEVKAYDITIFQDTDESFYNSYLPLRFGTLMNTPEDRGWYMINFNYLPGEHQPSGHINLSRAREFYIKYTSSFISKTNKCDMIVLSDAINFLLVQNGTAVLRFST